MTSWSGNCFLWKNKGLIQNVTALSSWPPVKSLPFMHHSTIVGSTVILFLVMLSPCPWLSQWCLLLDKTNKVYRPNRLTSSTQISFPALLSRSLFAVSVWSNRGPNPGSHLHRTSTNFFQSLLTIYTFFWGACMLTTPAVALPADSSWHLHLSFMCIHIHTALRWGINLIITGEKQHHSGR